MLLLSVNDCGFGVVCLIHFLWKPNQTGLNWQINALAKVGEPSAKASAVRADHRIMINGGFNWYALCGIRPLHLPPSVKWMITFCPGKWASLFKMYLHLCLLSHSPLNRAVATNVTGPMDLHLRQWRSRKMKGFPSSPSRWEAEEGLEILSLLFRVLGLRETLQKDSVLKGASQKHPCLTNCWAGVPAGLLLQAEGRSCGPPDLCLCGGIKSHLFLEFLFSATFFFNFEKIEDKLRGENLIRVVLILSYL